MSLERKLVSGRRNSKSKNTIPSWRFENPFRRSPFVLSDQPISCPETNFTSYTGGTCLNVKTLSTIVGCLDRIPIVGTTSGEMFRAGGPRGLHICPDFSHAFGSFSENLPDCWLSL